MSTSHFFFFKQFWGWRTEEFVLVFVRILNIYSFLLQTYILHTNVHINNFNVSKINNFLFGIQQN